MNIVKYPDGSSYASTHPIKAFTFKVNSYEDGKFFNQKTLTEIREKLSKI